MCYYYDILREPKQDDPVLMCRVNVIPGHIGHDNRHFQALLEKSTGCFAIGHGLAKQPPICVPKKAIENSASCYGGQLEVLVTESLTKEQRPSLQMEFGVVDSAGLVVALISPSAVVYNVFRGTGLVPCQNDGCEESGAIAQEVATAIADQEGSNPIYQLNIAGSQVILFRDDPAVRLFVALICWEPLIQRRECIPCCLRTRQKWMGQYH